MIGNRKPLTDDDPRHGTENGWTNYGCRCPECREAWRIYHWEYMERHPEQREKHRNRMRRHHAVERRRRDG